LTGVLLCYDGSESSSGAITVAGALLSPRDALVCHAWSGLSRTMLHAEPSELPGALADAAERLDAVDREAAEALAAGGVAVARESGFEAEPLLVRSGRKDWRALLEAADEHHAAVIVAGAHGVSGIGRALLGSVSTALVHHARRPVLIVPSMAKDEPRDGPLLLCSDGSDCAAEAIAAAGELMSERRSVALSVWESWASEAPALAGVSSTVQGMAAELDAIAAEQSRATAGAGVRAATEAGFEAKPASSRADGPAWKGILDAADDQRAAAIVVGSRGLTGISRALGSVSNGVVHHSRRPVLVVPGRPT
jgi:nucleotide-binding universal stress UspA family protein